MTGETRRFCPGSVTYRGAAAADYRVGRALSAEATAVWREVLEPLIGGRSSPTILDLGAGTGRFWPVLTSFPATRVVGLDPSYDMLAVAADQGIAGCTAVAGTAEHVPLGNRCCDLAWVSQSLHHVRDKAQAGRELVRVLRPSSTVLVRGTFSDRLDGFPTLFRFFPRARDLCTDLPTVEAVVAFFADAGMTLEEDRLVRQQTCGSLREFLDRSRHRADSSLDLMSDAEFHAGLHRLEEAVLVETTPVPVVEALTLLAFRTRPA
jgi:SAM-dependent methyltransferase